MLSLITDLIHKCIVTCDYTVNELVGIYINIIICINHCKQFVMPYVHDSIPTQFY